MKYGCQSMVDKITDVMIKRPQEAFKNQEHLNKYSEANIYYGIPDYEKCLEEFEVFEKILRDNMNVHYLPEDEITSLDSIFAHDSLKITKKGAIYFNMTKDVRKNEAEAAEAFLKTLGIPTLGYIKAPGRMEGGDVLWLEDNRVAIGLSYRTNAEGIRQFTELTKDFIDEVITVPMPHAIGDTEVLHLMSVISPVDKDLAVVYSRYMPVFFREMLIEQGVELLEVDDDEYNYLGCNVLAIAPREVIVIEGVPKIQKKLEDAGCKVYTYPGDEISIKETGGGVCFTAPLTRVKEESK
ncbi:MAG: arginine deiminase family protein [Tissierellia bacterium]|nr:arginine deiminase family protein [Tissierellia bacterium]